MVDRLLRERADDILDTDRAVRRVEAERHRHIGDKKPKEVRTDRALLAEAALYVQHAPTAQTEFEG